MPNSPDRLIALGRFGAPQGVRGEVRLQSYTAEPKSVAAYGALADKSGARLFAINIVRPLRDDMLVVRVEGVNDRDAAQALTGVELFARRSQLPPPDEDEFYYDDLIGLEAVTPEGSSLGRVTAVLNHGAGDILEIGELLLPFSKAVVRKVDFSTGFIEIVQPSEVEGEARP